MSNISELIAYAKAVREKIPFEGGVATYGDSSIYPANLLEVQLDSDAGTATCMFSYEAKKYTIDSLIANLEEIPEIKRKDARILIEIVEDGIGPVAANKIEWHRDYSVLAILQGSL